jgi:putative MFS transporter
MDISVNAGGRLDRLPISSFHYRIFWLVGAGMLLDGYDLYVFTNVLPAAAQNGFSTPLQNADFISKTFLGMTIGALVTGFVGDQYGRRFTYQINLLIFGLASLAAAFVIAGVGALIVWYLRKALPESPRWLEAQGRSGEAESLMHAIEKEASGAGPLPVPGPAAPVAKFSLASLVTPSLLPRMIVGSWVLITVNTLIFGFVTWLPLFFLQQGLTITRSFAYTLVIVLGTPFGAMCGAFCADFIGRRPTIIGASVLTIALGVVYGSFTAATAPWLILTVGFLLIVAIYVQVAMLFGVYTPELFPTDVRLRANGICHTFGRAATIVSPFIVLWLSQTYGIAGVLALMVALLGVQIVAVWGWGVEPRQRSLEQLDSVRPFNVGAAS